MISKFQNQIAELKKCIDSLVQNEFEVKLNEAVHICVKALNNRLPILVCGNGGSAADAQHIAGELVGQFLKPREALNVRALNTDSSVITAWANDVGYDTVFSRQVEAYGAQGGVLIAISTSGNSKNVLNAAKVAKTIGMNVIGLTGNTGGDLLDHCRVCLNVPSKITPRIQEMHVMVYHYLCEMIENLTNIKS